MSIRIKSLGIFLLILSILHLIMAPFFHPDYALVLLYTFFIHILVAPIYLLINKLNRLISLLVTVFILGIVILLNSRNYLSNNDFSLLSYVKPNSENLPFYVDILDVCIFHFFISPNKKTHLPTM